MLLLFILFIVLPLVEIAVFIEVGGEIGALTTILATVATAALGLFLFRIQGFVLTSRFRAAMASETPPVAEMLDGLGLAAMAVLLLIPGFVTDGLGLLLAIPALRRHMLRGLLIWLRARIDRAGGQTHVVIDGTFQDVTGQSTPVDPADRPRLDRK